VAVFIWFAIRSFLPKWLTPAIYSAVIATLFYALVVTSAIYFERKVVSDLAAFDSIHAGKELTSKQREIRSELGRKIAHDTGRTFAPITGAIGAVLYFALIWISIYTISKAILRANSGREIGNL